MRLTSNVTLEELTNDFRNNVLALMIYTCTLAIAGIIGNLFLLYVHLFKYKECNFRSFVLALCAVDIFDCVAIIPMEIYSQMYFYGYTSELICKTEAYFNVASSCAMTYILFFIAVDRHRKICAPCAWQLSRRFVKRICAVIFFVAAVYGFPIAILWGVNDATVVYKNGTVTIQSCGKAEAIKYTYWPKMYIFLLIPNFVLMSIMVGLYILVFCRLSNRNIHEYSVKKSSFDTGLEKVKRSVSSLSGRIRTGVQNIRNSGTHVIVKNSLYNPTKRLEQCKSETSWYTETGLDLEDIGKSEVDSNKISVGTQVGDRVSIDDINSRINKQSKRLFKRKRTTILTFTFTVSFICTGILYMVLGSSLADHNDHIRTVSVWKDVLFLFGYRLFFLNYILHPILYGFMDPYFRKSLYNFPRDFSSSFRRRPRAESC